MPITPRFRLSQTPTQLIITIHIPHIRVSASTIELVVDGPEIHFYSTPYLLHLTFPGRLLDEEETKREARAVYDPSRSNGMLTVTVWKEEEGLWEDLDLLGRLMVHQFDSENNLEGGNTLNCKDEKNSKISVIASAESLNGTDIKRNVGNDGETFNFEDELHADDIKSCLKPHYGFLNMHHSVFTAYAREGLSHEMLELPDPDETLPEDRRQMRLDIETEKFDPNRYLGDLDLSQDGEDGDMIYQEAVRMTPHWQQHQSGSSPSVQDITNGMNLLSTDNFNTKEHGGGGETLMDSVESQQLASIKSSIPNINKISEEQNQSLLLSLMDILYAYAYDHRTTSGDPTCESSWTIAILSPTLSWFEQYTTPYDTITDVLRWSIRRALIYPYLRNFDFVSKQITRDVATIFSGGRRGVLRCLLQIQKVLEKSEFHYLLNKLYINPLICWVQCIDEDKIRCFSLQIKECLEIEKDTLGMDLVHIEKDRVFDEESERESDDEGETQLSSESDEDSQSDDSSDNSSSSSSSSSYTKNDNSNNEEHVRCNEEVDCDNLSNNDDEVIISNNDIKKKSTVVSSELLDFEEVEKKVTEKQSDDQLIQNKPESKRPLIQEL